MKYAISCVLFLLLTTQQAFAVTDPLKRNNNFVGVHILFTTEVEQAAKLVNSTGGEWGYVLIPLQTTDLDLKKWQKFMDEAKHHKVIPIIRIATEPYYKNTHTWRVPYKFESVDFANFLNSLDWPTKNKYVVIYNEINRFDEWGGLNPDPIAYADILHSAVDEFKEKDEDFYIIMGGLDNAAPNDGKHISNYTFLESISNYKPEIFDKIDAFSSHSYPNPAFAQPPSDTKMSTSTYLYEYEIINRYTTTKKPAFITETGWDANIVEPKTVAEYYKTAFYNWSKDSDKIVAVTPFLLSSHGGFDQFSLLLNGGETPQYRSIKNFNKTKGDPILEKKSPAPKKSQSKKVLTFNLSKKSYFSYDKIPELIKSYGRSLLF